MDYNFDDNGRSRIDENRRKKNSALRRKERRKKLIIRRTVIIAGAILVIAVVVTLLVLLFKLLFAPSAENQGGALATANQIVQPTEIKNSEALTFTVPDIADDKKTKGNYSGTSNGVYIYNNAAYECFNGTADSAKTYADAIKGFKNKAGDSFTVYNMVVPNHTEFGIPRRLIEDKTVSSVIQADNIKQIYQSYTDEVIPINCYNKLSEHCREYIYFNTDTAWTGLGAYYGYAAFCEQTNQKTLDLSVCKEHTIEGFEGSLADYDPALSQNLDTVHYWTFPYDTYAVRTAQLDEEPYETSVYYEGEESGPYSYGVFIWGDGALFVEHNKDLDNGKKIAVVKESYGNALVPYLTADYQEVHVIDFRYFDENLIEYCNQNSITEVLFINNTISANTALQVDRIKALY